MSAPEKRISFPSSNPEGESITLHGDGASSENTKHISSSEALERSEVIVYPSGKIEVRVGIDIESTVIAFNERAVKDSFRSLAERLCKAHPTICTNKSIFGGVPHIKNVRLSVGDILAKLYVYGNIQKIVEIYSPHVSEEQVKEAIAYAQDFLEAACDPDESSETDD